jgi:CRISPR-associated protein Csx3
MNNKMTITITEKADYTVIEFNLKENFSPNDIKTISPPDLINEIRADKGIILSGRGPIWLYGYLIHFYHPTKFVATHDPRLKGAVVVESHSENYKAGDVINME